MSGVALDTSGTVRRPGFARPLAWTDLDAFERGCVEALLTGPIEYPDPAEGWGPSCAPRFDWLAPETLASILKDCASFQNVATGLGVKKLGATEGRNFWIGRNASGHGLAPVFAAAFPPITAQLRDDGKVYLRGVA